MPLYTRPPHFSSTETALLADCAPVPRLPRVTSHSPTCRIAIIYSRSHAARPCRSVNRTLRGLLCRQCTRGSSGCKRELARTFSSSRIGSPRHGRLSLFRDGARGAETWRAGGPGSREPTLHRVSSREPAGLVPVINGRRPPQTRFFTSEAMNAANENRPDIAGEATAARLPARAWMGRYWQTRLVASSQHGSHSACGYPSACNLLRVECWVGDRLSIEHASVCATRCRAH